MESNITSNPTSNTDERISAVDQRLAKVEEQAPQYEDRFVKVCQCLEQLAERVAALEDQLARTSAGVVQP